MIIEYWLHIEAYASNDNMVHIKKYIDENFELEEIELDFFIDNSNSHSHDMLLDENEHKTLIVACKILEEHYAKHGIDYAIEMLKALDELVPKEHNFLLEDAEGEFFVEHRADLKNVYKLQEMNKLGLFWLQ